MEFRLRRSRGGRRRVAAPMFRPAARKEVMPREVTKEGDNAPIRKGGAMTLPHVRGPPTGKTRPFESEIQFLALQRLEIQGLKIISDKV